MNNRNLTLKQMRRQRQNGTPIKGSKTDLNALFESHIQDDKNRTVTGLNGRFKFVAPLLESEESLKVCSLIMSETDKKWKLLETLRTASVEDIKATIKAVEDERERFAKKMAEEGADQDEPDESDSTETDGDEDLLVEDDRDTDEIIFDMLKDASDEVIAFFLKNYCEEREDIRSRDRMLAAESRSICQAIALRGVLKEYDADKVAWLMGNSTLDEILSWSDAISEQIGLNKYIQDRAADEEEVEEKKK